MSSEAEPEEDSTEHINVLAAVCDEGRRTLEIQVGWIREIDRKAMQVLRANILLVGLTLTALSIFLRTDSVSISPFVNIFSVLGIGSLLGSTFFAGVTFVSSRYEAGIGHNDIRDVYEDEYTIEEVFNRLSKGYTNWVGYNDFVIKFNAWLCAITILLAVDAVILISTGVAIGSVGLDGSRNSYLLFAVFVLFLVFLNYLVLKLNAIMNWTHARIRHEY